MPRISNTPKEAASPDLILANKLIAEFRQLWVDQLKDAGVSHVDYSRISLVALNQLAATIAVDLGMKPQQFTAMCGGAYMEAYKQAPKFS